MDEKADGGALGGHAGKTNVWESGVTDTHPLDGWRGQRGRDRGRGKATGHDLPTR